MLPTLEPIVPLKYIEYGFGYIIIRSPYTPYSIYLRGIIHPKPEAGNPDCPTGLPCGFPEAGIHRGRAVVLPTWAHVSAGFVLYRDIYGDIRAM